MARMILTYRVMPEDGEIEYQSLEKVAKDTIKGYDETVTINSVQERSVGFGLKAVIVNFSIEETKGSEALEEELKAKEEVGDVIVESMSRALG